MPISRKLSRTADRERFLSFLADVTTFNGGIPSELRGRDAVMEGVERLL